MMNVVSDAVNRVRRRCGGSRTITRRDQRPMPSPDLYFSTITAYQRTAALKGALALDLFTAIAQGRTTASALADHAQASPRGMRILCDYLTTLGFLTKHGDRYELSADSAAFLDRRSPAYLGESVGFIASPFLADAFRDVADAVRRGGTALPDHGTLAPDHPAWAEFARTMLATARTPAELAARLVGVDRARPARLLDVAAGHGAFGLAFAERYPNVHVVALDWPAVLEVARQNATRAKVDDRYRTLAGNAFDVDWGEGFDLVLLGNVLHHFGRDDCADLLRKARAALAPSGRLLTMELIPNDDRVTPAASASFALVMLCTTPRGDAYTFTEYDRMFREAGFARSELHPLPPTMQHLIVSFA
jgi:ubiquinone/menaquinone biosynthesis C-methylase UbiE